MKAYVMLSHYINIYNLIVNIMQNQYNNNKNRCILLLLCCYGQYYNKYSATKSHICQNKHFNIIIITILLYI